MLLYSMKENQEREDFQFPGEWLLQHLEIDVFPMLQKPSLGMISKFTC